MTDIVYDVSPTGHYMELYAKKNILLGAHNLRDGEDLVAEISGVSEAKVYSKADKKDIPVVVLVFTNKIKMALNISNARTIAGLYGDNRTGWNGKSVQVYKAEVRNPAGKGTVPGLKIREKIPDTGESTEDLEASLRSAGSIDELIAAWKAIPKQYMARLESVKEEVKAELSK